MIWSGIMLLRSFVSLHLDSIWFCNWGIQTWLAYYKCALKARDLYKYNTFWLPKCPYDIWRIPVIWSALLTLSWICESINNLMFIMTPLLSSSDVFCIWADSVYKVCMHICIKYPSWVNLSLIYIYPVISVISKRLIPCTRTQHQQRVAVIQ
jgi:hypothetical protein